MSAPVRLADLEPTTRAIVAAALAAQAAGERMNRAGVDVAPVPAGRDGPAPRTTAGRARRETPEAA
jgi:hypothetical protein